MTAEQVLVAMNYDMSQYDMSVAGDVLTLSTVAGSKGLLDTRVVNGKVLPLGNTCVFPTNRDIERIAETQSGGPWTPLEPGQGEWTVLSDNRSGWVPLPPEQGNLTPHQEWEQRRDAFINQYFSGRTLTPELLEIVNASVGPEPEQ